MSLKNLLNLLYGNTANAKTVAAPTFKPTHVVGDKDYSQFPESIVLKPGSFVQRKHLIEHWSVTEEFDEGEDGFDRDKIVDGDVDCLYFDYGNIRYCVNIADIELEGSRPAQRMFVYSGSANVAFSNVSITTGNSYGGGGNGGSGNMSNYASHSSNSVYYYGGGGSNTP